MDIDPKLKQMLLETFKGELTEQHQRMVELLMSLDGLEDAAKQQEALTELFRISHNLKGAAKSVAIDKISDIAHQLEDIFSVLKAQKEKPEQSVIDESLLLADKMIDVFHALEENEDAPELKDTLIQLPFRRVERLAAKINELVIVQQRLSRWSKELSGITQIIHKLSESSLLPVQQRVSELLTDTETFSEVFSRELTALQQASKSMQLLPVSHLFFPLKRVVRDLAHELNKEVTLTLKGENVEVDKSTLDALKMPIQHLVRNAIAHGIEQREVREASSKPSKGQLHIEARNEAGNIQLILKDDGRGIDLKKLKEKAVTEKLYTQQAIDKLTHQEALSLIFESGLSTAEQVSNIAGRGVGLDAVLSDIKRLRGQIHVESTPYKGTTFTLNLPVSISSVRGLFVTAGHYNFVFPLTDIEALYDVKLNELSYVDNQWIMQINQKPVAVFSLLQLMGVDMRAVDRQTSYYGVLVASESQRVILLVDKIIEEHECVVKPLPHPIQHIEFLSGASLGESGDLFLVPNIVNLIQKVGSGEIDTASLMQKAEIEAPKRNKKARHVLVVDDSLTARTLSVNALRADGYQVLEAQDGEQAWQMIQSYPIDCVVADIEMPAMDGFELIKNIKSEPNYEGLPVVVVSSRDASEDKQKALQLGASQYLVKKDFETRKLIDAIGKLL